MNILAIETSLDDTSAAVTQDNRILSNVVASQVKFHEEWGGTVPDIARRKHQEWMEPVIAKAIKQAHISESKIDAVAVTYGPGLAPSLEVGIDHAKAWATKLQVPFIPINHLEGHLLSSLAKNSQGNGGAFEEELNLPAVGFLISGGHTELVLVKAIGEYYLLGETLDDAAGEAYDKVARMLKLGYPGGPILSELAKVGIPQYKLPVPMIGRKDLDFSFSGLKTAALNALRKLEDVPHDKQFVADFSASFQQAALTHLMKKLELAIKLYQPRTVLLGGGVVSNATLRNAARKVAKKYHIPVTIPYCSKLFTDSAGMIGVAAWYVWQQKRVVENPMAIERQPNLNFPRIESSL
jgi:N6-L-threonylcarbamoyladenine synthase